MERRILNNEVFFFDLMKKYAILFGAVFQDMKIARTAANGSVTQVISVPLLYGPKDKMLSRVISDPKIARTSEHVTLPAMSMEVATWGYDKSRKIGTTLRMKGTPASNTGGPVSFQYTPVPYDIGFQLHVATKNVDDGNKIIEQILPFFAPDWTIPTILIDQMDYKTDVRLVLDGVECDDVYDGQFTKRRAITWTLKFVMKAYFMAPIKSGKVIKFVNTNFYSVQSNTAVEAVGVSPVNETMTIQPGLDANGNPTSNLEITIPYTNINADDNYTYITVVSDPQAN